MQKLIEYYRKEIIKEIFETNSFKNAWDGAWQEKIKAVLEEEGFLNLTEKAKEIFKTTSDGRGQGAVSSAGIAWECFLTWYLNLGLVGTRTIVIKPKAKFNLQAIKDTVTVNYGEFTSSSETDLISITFPKENEIAYTTLSKKNLIEIKGTLENAEELKLSKVNESLNEIIKENIHKIKVNVIQCKTNWNDNAQIPMAWDMIYSATGFQDRSISIGKNGLSIHKLEEFKYSFITVPSNNNDYKRSTTSVLRVRELSGSNFWGLPTKDEVAHTISDIFTLNYSESFSEKTLEKRHLENDIAYFKL